MIMPGTTPLGGWYRALETAISQAELSELQRLLEVIDSQTDVARQEARDLLNYSLGSSCRHGQTECVRVALKYKAQVDIKCSKLDFLPLFYAAKLPRIKADQTHEIIAQLVEAGADLDARDQDHNGSNALMWAKTEEAAQALLYHAGVLSEQRGDSYCGYINSRDNDGKTALMWSIITLTDVSVSAFLKEKSSDMSLTDDQGSTLLHWAARSNNCSFAEVLLKAGNKANIRNLGGRTPLHLAVGKNHDEMVELLLRYDIEDPKSGTKSTLDAKSAGGWLPLHVACGAPGIQPTIAWRLIERSKIEHLLQPNSTGKTPVIIAADRGNIAVVEQLQVRVRQLQKVLQDERAELLQRQAELDRGAMPKIPDEKVSISRRLDSNSELYTKLLSARGMRDNDGNIALFNAGICESQIAREFLAPWNLDDAVRDVSANIPTKQFQAKVVDLLTEPRKIDVGRMSVFDLIYANPELSHSVTKRTLPRKACTYRWIHLPANKRSWCRDLFAKYFIELWYAGRISQEKCPGLYTEDIDTEEDNQTNGNANAVDTEDDNSLNPEDTGKIYTIEHFQKIARTLSMQRIGRTTHSAYMTPRCRPIVPAHDKRLRSRRFSEPTFLDDDYSDDDTSASEFSTSKFSRSHQSPQDEGDPARSMHGRNAPSPSLFVYMPYLHFEYFIDLYKMKESLSVDPHQPAGADGPGKLTPDGPYSTILFTGLHGEPRDYHQRRTLDQFFYRNIITDERDKDQVAYRYQRRAGPNGSKTSKSDCKVIMVDELWMWIINDEFIVTCFPERWNQRTKGEFDIWENVLDRITARGPESAPTVYHLAALISDTCSKAFDLCDTGKPRFIDVFEGSLGNAMEGAMTASRRLNDASIQGSKWLRSVSEELGDEHRSNKNERFEDDDASLPASQPKPSDSQQSTNAGSHNDDDGMEFVDSLLDLRNETDLVYQISDTRDEIEILSMVLSWQKRILQELSSALVATEPVDAAHRRCRRPIEFIDSSLRTVKTTMSDLKRMDKQAKRIYSTVTNILDMKQKYANAIEARSVRAGGLTIMIFTVATVFFLPASFIVSFFGLNLSTLPHQDGDVSLSPGLVCRWVLGLGLGIALVYLAVAFQMRKILRWLGVHKIRRWYAKKNRWRKIANANPHSKPPASKSSLGVSRVSTGVSFVGSNRRQVSILEIKEDV